MTAHVMADDIERSIRALPHDMQDRMARLVLGGWVFSKTLPGWDAKHVNVWKKLYWSSTLLTLLYQMEGVVEDTEAGGTGRLPDAASPTGRAPSHPEIQNLPSR